MHKQNTKGKSGIWVGLFNAPVEHYAQMHTRLKNKIWRWIFSDAPEEHNVQIRQLRLGFLMRESRTRREYGSLGGFYNARVEHRKYNTRREYDSSVGLFYVRVEYYAWIYGRTSCDSLVLFIE
jgi:hypothetical protein